MNEPLLSPSQPNTSLIVKFAKYISMIFLVLGLLSITSLGIYIAKPASIELDSLGLTILPCIGLAFLSAITYLIQLYRKRHDNNVDGKPLILLLASLLIFPIVASLFFIPGFPTSTFAIFSVCSSACLCVLVSFFVGYAIMKEGGIHHPYLFSALLLGALVCLASSITLPFIISLQSWPFYLAGSVFLFTFLTSTVLIVTLDRIIDVNPPKAITTSPAPLQQSSLPQQLGNSLKTWKPRLEAQKTSLRGYLYNKYLTLPPPKMMKS